MSSFVPCGEHGPASAWRVIRRLATSPPRRPRCNRPEAHRGDHARYNGYGAILASWERGDHTETSAP